MRLKRRFERHAVPIEAQSEGTGVGASIGELDLRVWLSLVEVRPTPGEEKGR